MRLLRIAGNSVYKRLTRIAKSLGCCDTLWKDSEAWSDDCEWKEPTCDGDIWVNSEIWKNECPWT